jgi:hypothetical protein
MIQPQPKEPRISLPHKFDGLWSKFQNFVNQVRLSSYFIFIGIRPAQPKILFPTLFKTNWKIQVQL